MLRLHVQEDDHGQDLARERILEGSRDARAQEVTGEASGEEAPGYEEPSEAGAETPAGEEPAGEEPAEKKEPAADATPEGDVSEPDSAAESVAAGEGTLLVIRAEGAGAASAVAQLGAILEEVESG